MLKVAILDDYQNVSQQFVDIKKLSGKYEFKIFSEPFLDEAETLEQIRRFWGITSYARKNTNHEKYNW